MIVLIDQTSLDTPSRTRGHGRYVHELSCGLAQLPASECGGIRWLALTHLNPNGDYRVSEDIAAFKGSPEIPTPTSKNHYHWAYSRRFGLSRAVRSIGAAAVHLGDPNSTPLLMNSKTCKKVVTCHDTIPARYPKRYFGIHDGGPIVGLAIEKRRYNSADLVLAVSGTTERDAHSYLGVRPEKMVRIYNGVDVKRWMDASERVAPEVAERYGLADRKFMLYVGGADWHKNVDGMVAGIAKGRGLGADVTLAWAGRIGPEARERLDGIARQHGLAEGISWLGYVADDDLAVLYRMACAHVLLSHYEGFGYTIVEAMASGCPVLTTVGGSIGEVAGDAALTVDPNDYNAIGRAVSRLASDGELRAELSRRGRARAWLFTREAQAKAFAGAFRRLLGT